MPNWCFNKLRLAFANENGKKQLHDFVDSHIKITEDGIRIDNSSIIPEPEGIVRHIELKDRQFETDDPAVAQELGRQADELAKENLAKYGYPTWYEFRLDKWGSKWGFCSCNVVGGTMGIAKSIADLHRILDEYEEIVFNVESAWCPPTGLVKAITEKCSAIILENLWCEEQVTQYSGKMVYTEDTGFTEVGLLGSELWETLYDFGLVDTEYPDESDEYVLSDDGHVHCKD